MLSKIESRIGARESETDRQLALLVCVWLTEACHHLEISEGHITGPLEGGGCWDVAEIDEAEGEEGGYGHMSVGGIVCWVKRMKSAGRHTRPKRASR